MENNIIYSKIRSITKTFVEIPSWKVMLSLILPFVVLFFATPSFQIINEHWDPIIKQAENPFLSRNYPAHSHASKLAFRFIPAIIVGWLHLSIKGIIIWQYINGALLFYVSALVIEKLTKNKFLAFYTIMLTAFIFSGKVSFINFKDTFDSLILVLLLLCFLNPNKILLFLLILVSSFIDERALVCSGFIFLYYFYLQIEHKKYRLYLVTIFFSWFIYFSIRTFLANFFGLQTSTGGVDFKTMSLNLNFAPLSIWQAFEGGWIVVLIFISSIFYSHRFFLILLLGQLLIILFIAFLVFDVTRSLVYLYPLLIIAIVFLNKNILHRKKIEYYTFLAMIISFLYPSYCSAGDTNNWLLPLPLKLIFEYFTS